MLDKIYLEIKQKWNQLRAVGYDPEMLQWLVHLMEEIESENPDDYLEDRGQWTQ